MKSKPKIIIPINDTIFNKTILHKITKVGFKIGVTAFLLIPPFIVWWKEYSF